MESVMAHQLNRQKRAQRSNPVRIAMRSIELDCFVALRLLAMTAARITANDVYF